MFVTAEVLWFKAQVRCHTRALGGAWTQPPHTQTHAHTHRHTHTLIKARNYTLTPLSLLYRLSSTPILFTLRHSKTPLPLPYTQTRTHTHNLKHIKKISASKQAKRLDLQTSSVFIWSAFLSPCLLPLHEHTHTHTRMHFSPSYSLSLSYTCLKIWYPSNHLAFSPLFSFRTYRKGAGTWAQCFRGRQPVAIQYLWKQSYTCEDIHIFSE